MPQAKWRFLRWLRGEYRRQPCTHTPVFLTLQRYVVAGDMLSLLAIIDIESSLALQRPTHRLLPLIAIFRTSRAMAFAT